MAFPEAVPELDHALRNQFGLADRVVDEAVLDSSARRFRDRHILLPTFAQLADPSLHPRPELRERLTGLNPTPSIPPTSFGSTGTISRVGPAASGDPRPCRSPSTSSCRPPS